MNRGGIQTLLEKFQKGGLGAVIGSWVSTGGNLPISSDQIPHALGLPAIASLAGKLGTNAQSASVLIAKHLPLVIDALSPHGEVNGQQDLLSEGGDLILQISKSSIQQRHSGM